MKRCLTTMWICAAVALMMPVCVTMAAATDKPGAPLTVLVPPSGEKAYAIAGETFADLWEKVTGHRPAVKQAESAGTALPEGDLVLIGSDAVHPVVHELIYAGVLDSLDIVYGGDGYRILSLPHDGRRVVIVAGGSGRSTIYAVYDFFRRQAGAEYFWDGDVIPHRDAIELAGLDVREQPRFEYRGLRYFAHRGLHRFQAEHWDLDDWKREIDWLVKKRFNLFMLRTGIDDLFQRAFPDEVPYPPTDAKDPDAKPRSYDDRTSFWALKVSRRASQAGAAIRPRSGPAPSGGHRHDHPLVFAHAQFVLSQPARFPGDPRSEDRLHAADAGHLGHRSRRPRGTPIGS